MPVGRLNLFTALLSLAGAVLWLYLGEVPAGLIWLAVSLFWVVWAMRERHTEYEPQPLRRLWRRVWRSTLWT